MISGNSTTVTAKRSVLPAFKATLELAHEAGSALSSIWDCPHRVAAGICTLYFCTLPRPTACYLESSLTQPGRLLKKGTFGSVNIFLHSAPFSLCTLNVSSKFVSELDHHDMRPPYCILLFGVKVIVFYLVLVSFGAKSCSLMTTCYCLGLGDWTLQLLNRARGEGTRGARGTSRLCTK